MVKDFVMAIRNAKHAADGSITVEYEHPKYGWIPFSARLDDSEQLGRDLYAEAIAGTVDPVPAPTAKEVAAAAKIAKDTADAASAKVDAKVNALAAMTAAQVRAWVAANVSNLADAKDVMATLAVAVSIIARKL